MKETLRAIGFDEKEANIYLALLKQDGASVTELLEHTQIERRTIYDVLERLVQAGRASYFEENKTRKYQATKPEVLLTDLEQKHKEFQAIIPQLQQLSTSPKQAKVELLKGVKGLMTIFHEIVAGNFDHVSFGDLQPLIQEQRYAIIVKQFLRECQAKGLKEKIIYNEGEPISKIIGGQYKTIANEDLMPSPTLIYGNTVTQYVYTDPLTIIKITSEEVANTHRKYFEHFWKLGKKV